MSKSVEEQIVEVDAAMVKLEAKRAALKEELRRLAKQRDVLVYRAEVEKMPAAKREALMIAASGIESGETVGNPG